ncbi:uncharacterized protein LTR77_007511 [Saxophila tyrrhenica]|uniref:SET domain-containing protein n=1 Tax=Saxophila tyrrhenica TaxID=1690608 RepID=A0AAV9P7V7_9PEZI|nr:hypothetical protein LTR77_007511 [Saxophila tyrrhenica]
MSPPDSPLCTQRPCPLHGQGMFTTRTIPTGTLLFTERPLVLFPHTTVPWKKIWRAFLALPPADRTAWYNLTNPESTAAQRELAKQAGETKRPNFCGEVLAKYLNNSWKDSMAGMSLLGDEASRFNHSYAPNGTWALGTPGEGEGEGEKRFEVRAVREMGEGKELRVLSAEGKERQRVELLTELMEKLKGEVCMVWDVLLM